MQIYILRSWDGGELEALVKLTLCCVLRALMTFALDLITPLVQHTEETKAGGGGPIHSEDASAFLPSSPGTGKWCGHAELRHSCAWERAVPSSQALTQPVAVALFGNRDVADRIH